MGEIESRINQEHWDQYIECRASKMVGSETKWSQSYLEPRKKPMAD